MNDYEKIDQNNHKDHIDETLGTKLVRLITDIPEKGLHRGLIGSLRGGNNHFYRVEFNGNDRTKKVYLLEHSNVEEVRLFDVARKFMKDTD